MKFKNFWQSCLFLSLAFISGYFVTQMQENKYQDIINAKQNTDFHLEEKKLQTILNFQKTMPSFGFDNLISDWHFLQFIQYFGDAEARDNTGYSLVTDYFELMVDRDPRFIKAYLTLSTANSMFAGKPEKTISLMNRILSSLSPDAEDYPFLIWTYKAADEILFLGDLKAAQQSYETAAKWASLSKDDLARQVAKNYQKTAQFLSTNPDSRSAMISAWFTLLPTAKDPKIKQHILDKLKGLGAEVVINNKGEFLIRMSPNQV
jgi:hypothetical protein